MHAKGTFFVGRRQFIIERFGEASWNEYMAFLAQKDPIFRGPILATTMVPIASYIRFQEEGVRRFFQGNEMSYWEIGAQSGEWALTEGPYKNYRQNLRQFQEFVEKSLPRIWTSYFSEGELKTSVQGSVVEGAIVGLPVWHVCFEYAVMGFMRRAIELAGVAVKVQTRVRGVSAGDKAIHYRFETAA